MGPIQNLAVFGATGNLGSVVVPIIAKHFNITVLRRIGSSSQPPSKFKVIDVDYSSREQLEAALVGQDAVLSLVASAGHHTQPGLADAAAAAGVKRFIPSEFGSNIDNPNTRQLPVFTGKVKTQEHLKELAKNTSLTYTFVYNAAFLDWGIDKGFLFHHAGYMPTLFDGGDTILSGTTLATVGEAIVGILKHPEETINRSVYIQDLQFSQTMLLKLAKELAPEKPWKPVIVKLDDMTSAADEKVAAGVFDATCAVAYIMRSLFDPAYGAKFDKNDNGLLGLKGMNEGDLKEMLKKLIK